MMDTEELWNIPSQWSWTRLKAAGDIVAGGTPSTKESSYWGVDVNWISPADLTGYTAKTISHGAKSLSIRGLRSSSAKVMPAGSVHFSSRAPIGYVAISSEPLATNQGFKSLVPAKGVFNEYVYYYLKGSSQLAEKRASGTTFLELSSTAFGQLPFPLPPLNEQRRIVAKIEALFSELDKGKDSLKKARAQLKTYRQAVLKHAFEGKLTADWREQNKDKLEPAEKLLERIKAERQSRYQKQLKDWQQAVKEWEASGKEGKKPAKPRKPAWPKDWNFSDLDPIPDGWRYVPFETLAYSIRNGISQKPDEIGDLKIFRISAVRPMEFNLQDYRLITDATGELSSYCLTEGDLVFTRYNGSRAYVGVSAMYRGDGSHVYPDKLIRCELGSEFLNPGYLEKATNCGESRAFIEKRIRTTAGQSGVSGGDIKALPVPLCSPSEQMEINFRLEEALSNILQMTVEIEMGLQKSEALRQSILKKAFSGQLVPQNPNDEPASVLLERIRAEKAAQQTVKAKTKAKKKPKRKTAA